MKPLLWCSTDSFSKKLSYVLVEGETKLNLDNLGMGVLDKLKKKLNEQKVSTLDNNKFAKTS